ncbi:tetratricopeptide repeat protein [Streptomyces sp. CoH27]|uniref:tetratricopeptide repeat protein n=1 Tax=Streptomyces sp. CoH27 TaxID=2875763 RepID=UPI001CD33991|nr:tetratricopeptide repeat protein [Streptomyces sp. CoH27]
MHGEHSDHISGDDHIDFRDAVFIGPVTGKTEHHHSHHHHHGAAPTALESLPATPSGFTGREPELRVLLDALDPRAPDASTAVLVTAVSGLGGVGKTALALAAAHEARARGWFPGGALFVDLHGYEDTPATADLALQALLRALGVAPAHLPADAEERGALYRTELAGIARNRGSLLLLADNASSADQVRPLLPGCSGHRVLATSRHRLPALGARLLPLGELPVEAAVGLLDRALRGADPADTRIADDPQSAALLAELCGRLPLALNIAAALLSTDPGAPVHELVTELTEAQSRIDCLNDGERSVRLTFDLSYRRLPEAEARLLRLFALLPGTESGLAVVEALQGKRNRTARGLLAALERAHLVERGSRRGRWRLHDLVREYAAGKATAKEREAARARVMSFYLERARAADAYVSTSPDRPPSWSIRINPFRDREEALAWLDEERQNLVAATRWATDPRVAADVLRLAHRLFEYLRLRRYFDDDVAVNRAAQTAARRTGNKCGEAEACNRTGTSLRNTGRVWEAIEAHDQASRLFLAIGHDRGAAQAACNVGTTLGDVGRFDDSIRVLTEALGFFQRSGYRHDEAGVRTNLAVILRKCGRAKEAAETVRRAIDLYRETGDQLRESYARHGYGLALDACGKSREAVAACLDALAVAEEYGDRHGAAKTLYALGLIHDGAGEPERARSYWLRAAEAYDGAGDARNAARARRVAGMVPRC